MAGHFEEEGFFLREKSNCMVTVTPFMGKLKVHIRQFYVNEKGEKKPGIKNGITLELEEFDELMKLIPKVRDSTARYELRDTGIPPSQFELDLPVLDLDTVFLPSPPLGLGNSQNRRNRKRSKTKKFKNIPNSETQDLKDGKRKMINDCDHKCPKEVGFSYPGVVLPCSECK